MLLGFHPKESLVVSCVTGPAVGLTMRFDLDDLAVMTNVAEVLAGRLETAGADAMFLAIFTDECPADGGLPYADLVDWVCSEAQVRVIDAILVRDGRWWSFRCDDSACCPAAGTPLDESSAAATTLGAAFAIAGSRVLDDRDALVNSLAVDPMLDVTAARRGFQRSARRVAAMAPSHRVIAARTLVDELTQRFADPRAEAEEHEVCSLAAFLHDIAARDDVLLQAVSPRRREAVLRVLRGAVRRVAPPVDAPLCAVLAWYAYADGDGATANVAIDRALRSDPDYSLALLIAASLDRQVPPSALVEVMKGAARDLDARDAAG